MREFGFRISATAFFSRKNKAGFETSLLSREEGVSSLRAATKTTKHRMVTNSSPEILSIKSRNRRDKNLREKKTTAYAIYPCQRRLLLEVVSLLKSKNFAFRTSKTGDLLTAKSFSNVVSWSFILAEPRRGARFSRQTEEHAVDCA